MIQRPVICVDQTRNAWDTKSSRARLHLAIYYATVDSVGLVDITIEEGTFRSTWYPFGALETYERMTDTLVERSRR